MALSAAKIIESSHLVPTEVASGVITAALVVALVAIVIVASVTAKQKSTHELNNSSISESLILGKDKGPKGSSQRGSFEIG